MRLHTLRATASLREGLAETLTIIRLGVPPTLARTLRSTNSIESMIQSCRDHAADVKRWQNGQMVVRWIAAGMGEAASSSAASTAISTCQRCASPWRPPPPPCHIHQGGCRLTSPGSPPTSTNSSLPTPPVARPPSPNPHR
jgi:hypothetical protein